MCAMFQETNEPDWITSCVEQATVASSWKKVESKISRSLNQKLEKELNDPVQRQIIFQLLGDEIVHKHFQNYPNDPSVLNNIGTKKLEKKSDEMVSILFNAFDSITGGKNSKGKKGKFPEYGAFCQDTRDLVEAEVQKPSKSKKNKKESRKEKYSVEDTMATMLGYHSSMIHHFTSKAQLESLSFPQKLRMGLWAEYLCAKEKTKNRGAAHFQKTKKKFLQLQNNNDLNDSYAASNGATLKVNASVKKVFKSHECLRSVSSKSEIEQATEILQLYGTYSKVFHQHYTYWALPMQQIYADSKHSQNGDDNEVFATVALLLEKTLRLCSLSPDQLFRLASKVVASVEQADSELIGHIKTAASKNVSASINDFPKDIISLDERKNASVFNALSGGSRDLSEDVRKIITHPEIFIRKWIFEGFASILTPVATLFVWDQLFAHNWDSNALHDACLIILGLLKPWFLLANDFPKIKEVFLEEPGKLYTLDVKRAWQHLKKKKGQFRDIPAMNRNIIMSDAPPPKPPTPKPLTPKPPTPKPPTPKPPTPRLPTPKAPTPPPPPPPKPFFPWVPYGKEKVQELMSNRPTVNMPFDLYVDSIRFAPDNATVIKITGKILNIYLGRRDAIKIEAYPKLTSFFRNPRFIFKKSVNQERQPMNPDVVVMFRIYTIEKQTKKPVILGSCLFCPFSNKRGKQASLRVGGHQIRLRYGIPDPDFTVEHMLASHMDNNPLIPGATILIRVLPHGKEFIPAPQYETNTYRSEFARPNESENRLYTHYQQSKDFQSTVRDVALPLAGASSASDDMLERTIAKLFDKEGSSADEFPFERFVNYDKNMGVVILADKAVGLPIFLEGRYLQCLVQSYPGQETKRGNGKSQVDSFMTEDLDLDSSQRSPDWTDRATKMKPEYDDRSYLFVALYGLRPRYNPDKQTLVDKEGKPPKFDLQHSIAWSVVPLFDKGAAFAGTHIVPLIKGRPPENIEEKLGYLPFDFVCQKFKSSIRVFDSASVEITIWDGRFIDNECPPLPVHTKYLSISPNPKKYLAARKQNFGDSVTLLIRSGLLKPVSLSDNLPTIVSLLKRTFKENMNRALRNADFSELIESG